MVETPSEVKHPPSTNLHEYIKKKLNSDEDLLARLERKKDWLRLYLQPQRPKLGKNSLEQDFSQFRDRGDYKDKFTYWVAYGWQRFFESTNPLSVGLLANLRNKYKLLETDLPEMTNSPEDMAELKQKLESIKPELEPIERTVAAFAVESILYQLDQPQLSKAFIKRVREYEKRISVSGKSEKNMPQFLKTKIKADPYQFFIDFIRRDPNLHLVQFGKQVANEYIRLEEDKKLEADDQKRDIPLKEKQDILEREQKFDEILTKRKEILDQLVEGTYKGEHEETAERAYTALAKISHLAGLKKLARFNQWSLRRIQEALSSLEGEVIFRPVQIKAKTKGKGRYIYSPLGRILVGVSAGADVSRVYDFFRESVVESIERSHQLGILGLGFVWARAGYNPINALKNINYAAIPKTALRGGTWLALVASLYNAAKSIAALPPTTDPNVLAIELKAMQLLASNFLGALGLNIGAESTISWLVHHKDRVNALGEYLYFLKTDPQQAQKVLNKMGRGKWETFANLVNSPPEGPNPHVPAPQLIRLAKTLRNAEQVLMIHLIHNPSRYQGRIFYVDGKHHELNSYDFLEMIRDLQKKIYKNALRDNTLSEEYREKILKELEGQPDKTEAEYLIQRARLTTKLASLSTLGISSALAVAGFVPGIRDFLEGMGDTFLGADVKAPALEHIASLPFNPNLAGLFIDERASYPEKIVQITTRFDELYSVVSLYNNPGLTSDFKDMILKNYDLTPDQIKQLGQTLKENNLSLEDLKLIFRLIAAKQEIPEDQFIKQVSQELSGPKGTKASDLGSMVRALGWFGKDLNSKLAESVRKQNLVDELFGFADYQKRELLPRLGIDTKTLETQLELLPELAPEKKAEFLKNPLGIILDEKTVIVKDQDSPLVFQFQPDIKAQILQQQIEVLKIFQQMLASSNDEEFEKALRNPFFVPFMAETSTTIGKPQEKLPALIALLREDALKGPRPSSPEVFEENLKKAMHGDIKAFNFITSDNFISGTPPSWHAFKAYKPSDESETVFQTLANISKKAGLLRRIEVNASKFDLQTVSQTHVALDPDQIQALELSTPLSRFNIARILNGEIPLEDAIQQYWNQYNVVFVKNGAIEGQFRRVLQQSRSEYPEDMMRFLNALEGPSLSPQEFTQKLIQRNLLYLLGKAGKSGASDPATQLFELIVGGPGYQPTLNPDVANLPTFYHPEKYSFSYLMKLIGTSMSGKVPKEMEDVLHPALSQPRPELGKSSDVIAILCAKFEAFIAARRLLSVFGEDEVLRVYSNYVPMGGAIVKIGNTVGTMPILGFEDASQYYFAKSVDELNQGEKIILEGMIYRPYTTSPLRIFTENEIQNDEFGRKFIRLDDDSKRILSDEELRQQFFNQENITRKVALARLQTLVGKKIVINSDEIARQIETANFKNEIPQALQNHIPPKGYEFLAKILQPGNATPLPPNATFLPQLGVLVVDITEHPRVDPTIPKPLLETANLKLPTLSLDNEVKTYINNLTSNAQSQASIFNVKLPTNSPVSDVPIPVFEQTVIEPSGKISVIKNPGFAFVAYDEHGELLGQFDKTNILSNYPVQPGSTIKPFVTTFLLTKGFKLTDEVINSPGDWAIDGSKLSSAVVNPYDPLNVVSSSNKLTLEQALGISSNVPFQVLMQKYLKEHPEGWNEFQNFMRRFGMELVDQFGKRLEKPAPLTAIGTDVYIRSIRHEAVAYSILAKPENWFDTDKDKNLIEAIRSTTSALMDDKNKASPIFTMDQQGRSLLSSTCNGAENACAFKTGTVAARMNDGTEGTIYTLSAGIIDDGKGGKISAVGVMAGQSLKQNPQTQSYLAFQTNLRTIIKSPFGSTIVLPILRDLLQKLAKNR